MAAAMPILPVWMSDRLGEGYQVFVKAGLAPPRSLSNAVRAAILNGLPDGLFSVAFACMDGDVEILALNVVESIDVFFGRVAAFFTGKIETHYAALPEIDGELRHLQRHIHVAHSADNQSGRHPEVFTAPLQSL